MTKIKNIIHLDVDKNLEKYLKGVLYPSSLKEPNLKNIKDKNLIDAISFKSQSSFNGKIFSHFPKLKLLITRTVGTDHIDLSFCKSKKISVYNVPDYGCHNIAEHALALLLSAARNIIAGTNKTKKGQFSFEGLLATSLKGKTLGVIGTGRIGLCFIKLASSFGLEIIAFDAYENKKAEKEFNFKYVNLSELLEKSDFISIHIPLIPQTKHLIGEKEIKKMKDGVILVNTARGGILDTTSLVQNIKKFRAVCLDVLEDEQNFSKNNPLLRFDNVIITPHIAFYSDDSIQTIAKETLENIKRFERKDKTNRVL